MFSIQSHPSKNSESASIILSLLVSLGRTKVLLSNATVTTITVAWAVAGRDGLIGFDVLYKVSEDEDAGLSSDAVSSF